MSFSVMIEMAKKTLENVEVISDTRVRIPLSHNAIPFMSTGLFQNKVFLNEAKEVIDIPMGSIADYAKHKVAYIEVDTFVIPD
jgi:hypothetical protein